MNRLNIKQNKYQRQGQISKEFLTITMGKARKTMVITPVL